MVLFAFCLKIQNNLGCILHTLYLGLKLFIVILFSFYNILFHVVSGQKCKNSIKSFFSKKKTRKNYNRLTLIDLFYINQFGIKYKEKYNLSFSILIIKNHML